MNDGLVLTPGGYKLRSLVHHVPPGHRLHMSGRNISLLQQDGSLVRDIGTIEQRAGTEPLMPRNLSLPKEQLRATGQPPQVAPFAEVNGWVANTGWSNNSGRPITSFATTWVVPPEPRSKASPSQVIFLFNGIQNSTMIYQPVLQWGPSAAGGGQYWAVASWYADGQRGHSFFSSLIPVNVGSTLTGVMTLVAQHGNSFDYSCSFEGIADTTVPIQAVEELTWANETLEVYGVTDCSQYPNARRTSLTNINLQTGTAAARLDWSVSDTHTECGQHVKVVNGAATGGQIDIWYGSEILETA